MRTSNPTFNDKTFSVPGARSFGDAMTVNGTILKTIILLLCALLTAGWTWNRFLDSQDAGEMSGYIMIGAIGGFVVALVTVFKKTWAPVTAPIYALLEGLFLGGVSASIERVYPGIPMQAVAATFGTALCMLLAYRSGLIRVSQKFTLGVVAATGGIAVFYLVTMVLGFFHIQTSIVNGNGTISILFSLFVVGVAALNLVLDFNYIEQGAAQGAPRYMEWYSAFGLMVTLVWLYLEMLRLLSKMRSRR
ncbi:MAG TPA: Bax inhibitor-1/YccA family protein [Bryobacteraceae bacterium]|jgi:uncharacterized YccA/Bax inhibitor family protein